MMFTTSCTLDRDCTCEITSTIFPNLTLIHTYNHAGAYMEGQGSPAPHIIATPAASPQATLSAVAPSQQHLATTAPQSGIIEQRLVPDEASM